MRHLAAILLSTALAAAALPGQPPGRERPRLVPESGVLESLLKTNPELKRKLLDDPGVRARLARDPTLRGHEGGAELFTDPRLTARLLELDEVRGLLLTQDDVVNEVVRKSKPFSASFSKARLSDAAGDFDAAFARYQEAAELARGQGARAVEADVRLQAARAAVRDPESLGVGLAAFDRVVEIGSPLQRAVAHSEMALVLLDAGRKDEAVAALAGVDLQPVTLRKRAKIRLDVGRALERLDRPQDAYQSYRQALSENGGLTPAADAAFRILLREDEARPDEAAEIADALISARRLDAAGRNIQACIAAWPKRPGIERVCRSLASYYAAAAMSPAEFRSRESRFLRGVDPDSAAGRLVAEVAWAYLGEVPLSLDPNVAAEAFPAWSGEDAVAMSHLLKRTGDAYAREGEDRRALARYTAGWRLADNTEAALYALALVRRRAADLDEGGALLEQMIEAAFEEKKRAYQAADWLNILRYHLLLAELFETMEPPRWGSLDEVRSVVFQLERALRAQEKLGRRVPSPGLHYRLGRAYAATGRATDAWDQFVVAAGGFLRLRNPDDAAATVGAARGLDVEETERRAARLASLERAIERARRP